MKRGVCSLICLGMLFFLPGCQIEKDSTEKLRDLEFAVVEEHEIPKELLKEINREKEEPFQMTYADQGVLYIVRGYGEQERGGCSVMADDVYESENAICVHTNLLGPKKGEEIREEEICPYLVIKTEWIDKYVIFK